jgi:hypothetical protein
MLVTAVFTGFYTPGTLVDLMGAITAGGTATISFNSPISTQPALQTIGTNSTTNGIIFIDVTVTGVIFVNSSGTITLNASLANGVMGGTWSNYKIDLYSVFFKGP